MLVGLVTKNDILIGEFVNEQRLVGLNKFEAAVESTTLRLRLILMTMLVAAFGALPMALAQGSASVGNPLHRAELARHGLVSLNDEDATDVVGPADPVGDIFENTYGVSCRRRKRGG